jgi:hypothetical protein
MVISVAPDTPHGSGYRAGGPPDVPHGSGYRAGGPPDVPHGSGYRAGAPPDVPHGSGYRAGGPPDVPHGSGYRAGAPPDTPHGSGYRAGGPPDVPEGPGRQLGISMRCRLEIRSRDIPVARGSGVAGDRNVAAPYSGAAGERNVVRASFPLDACRWLGRNIIEHAVDAFDLVENPVAGLAQQRIRQLDPVGSHGIFGNDGT